MEKKVDYNLAGKMLAVGKNFSEIAREFGVSRQAIYNYYLGRPHKEGKRAKTKYATLNSYLRDNNTNVYQMCKGIYGAYQKSRYTKLLRLFYGKAVNMTIADIMKIVRFIGIPFEELFGEEE